MTLYFIKNDQHKIKVVCFNRVAAVDELFNMRCNECSDFHYIDEFNVIKWLIKKL